MRKVYTWIIRIFLIVAVPVFVFKTGLVLAQTTTPTPTPDSSSKVADLQKKIDELEKAIAQKKEEGRTISNQISVMDNQIRVTELRINATQAKINELEKDITVTKDKIGGLEDNIHTSVSTMLGRITATYTVGSINPFEILLTSDTLENFMKRLTYLKIVQAADKKNLYAAEQAKVTYAQEKEKLEQKQQETEDLRKKLDEYTSQIEGEKAQKKNLLDATKNDEKKYQQMLAQAKAQINSFKSFASFSGGSILPAQASPDGWYYNQRDERWGKNTIGASSERVWEVGCLVTATAMLRKQRGENVTPADVAAEQSYFFADTAMMSIPWNGGRFTSRSKDMGAIDSKLANGTPVIVGLNAGPYGTHFIVLKSGSGGSYVMNDPWNGANLNFSSYYSVGQIFQYGYLN